MANIVIFQHDEAGSPGRLGRTLRDHGFHLDIRRLDRAADADAGASRGGVRGGIPVDLDNVHGVVSLGGPRSASDAGQILRREMEFLRDAHEAGLPVIGIGLGARLLAQALGGELEPLDTPVIGFEPLSILVPGQTETLLAGIPWTHRAFQMHAERIASLPETADKLAESDGGIQIFKAGHCAFGFAFHFEADLGLIGRLIDEDPRMLERAGLSCEELEHQTKEHLPRFSTIADRLCINIASFMFSYAELLSA